MWTDYICVSIFDGMHVVVKKINYFVICETYIKVY